MKQIRCLLALFLVCFPAISEAATYKTGSRADPLINSIYEYVQRKQGDAGEQRAFEQQMALQMINSGQYRLSQPGEPVDTVVAGVALTRSDRTTQQSVPAPAGVKFCPVGGEEYPATIAYCPIHGVELRSKQ